MTANELSFWLQMLLLGLGVCAASYVFALWFVFGLGAGIALVSGALILNAWES